MVLSSRWREKGMGVKVHPFAVVEKGPFSYIGPNVKIGRGVKIGTNVHIEGHTEIGENCVIRHGAAIGFPPQDVAFKGEKSFVKIGKNNTIREFVTIHRASGEGESTIVGDNNFIMAYAHLAHNVKIGSNVVIVNGAQLAGYVEVGDRAFISGLVAIHQFVRIGAYAIVGGVSRVSQDVPPFFMAVGIPLRVVGLNIVGLRRNGFSSERISIIKKAYKILYRSGLKLSEAIKKIEEELPLNEDIKMLLDFLKASKRGITLKGGER